MKSNLYRAQMQKAIEKVDAIFWACVSVRSEDECWLFIDGILNSSGYARYGSSSAHIEAYKKAKGKIPKELCVLHHCGNKICCNPKHLWLGTKSDNSIDCWNKGRNIFQTNPEIRPRGNKHANTKIKDEDLEDIRRLYETGLTQKEIAFRYRVSQTLISQITRRVTR